MKRFKAIISLLTTAAMALALLPVMGCRHVHTFSDTWVQTETEHWREATCEHTDEKGDYGEHDFDENYVCKVCGYRIKDAGISISKTVTEYTLSTSNPTVDVPVNDITVKLARVNESLAEEISDYTLEFYKGKERLENLNGLSSGAYNIWAKATVNIEGTMLECESFLIVYVIDDLDKIEFNKNAEGTVTTQGKSVIDRMSNTWTFTATYKSGRTEQITADDLLITGLDTNKVTGGAGATATYTVYNSKGVPTSKTVGVFYTVTASQNTVNTYTYSFAALKATLSETNQAASSVVLAPGALGGNTFATILGDNTAWYRGPTNNVLEIQHDALKVTITGVGTISLGVSSTSSTNISSIALMDSEGNYVAGTIGTSNVEKDDDINAYSITGKDGTIIFIILTPGEYTICTVDDVTVEGDVRDTNRHTRITSLEVVDEIS